MFKFNKKNLSNEELRTIQTTLLKDFDEETVIDIMCKGLKLSKDKLLVRLEEK